MIQKVSIFNIIWQGPFSWPGYEKYNSLKALPDGSGVYLLTFRYNDGFLIYCAGLTNSFINRFKQHNREYFKGNYTVLNVSYAEKGIRKEVWHGWTYAKSHRDEFTKNKLHILKYLNKQLANFRIFITEVDDNNRTPDRLETAIMNTLYAQLPPISEIPDKGMFLAKRRKNEKPIILKNGCKYTIFGLPQYLEI